MQQRNYTNPLDKGRYGFSASGKFNAPYKLETFLISIVIAVGIVAAVLIVIFAMSFVRSNPTGLAAGRLLEAIFGIGILLGAVAVVFVTGFLIKVIMQGYTCSYIADEEKFILDYGGTNHTIYYAEVQNVHFMPRSFFKKVHGYHVTVKINSANEEFAITSDRYLSESATPFYIIKERMELLRNEAELRRDAAARANSYTSNPVAPVQRDEVPLTDKVAAILGKDAAMPGISAETRPDIVEANRAKNDPIIPEYPGLAGKVSSTVGGYAADMPAVGADGKVLGSTPTYIGADGREISVYDVIAAGSFREAMKPGKAIVIAVIALVVYVFIYIFGGNLAMTVSNSTRGLLGGIDPLMPLQVGMIAVIIIAPFYAGTVINFLKKGDIYTYKANGREFVVTSKSKKEEQRILYADVQDVVYSKTEFLWFVKGYRVEIMTTYGVIKYNYVCEGLRLPDTSSLPFEVIKEHIGA